MKKYTPLLIIPLLTGCMQQPTKNTVKYNGLVCACDRDVSLYLNGDNGYECKCGDNNYIKPIPIKYKSNFKTNFKNDECPTIITEIFNSKEFKKPLVICKGRLLEGNEKTRVVKVNK